MKDLQRQINQTALGGLLILSITVLCFVLLMVQKDRMDQLEAKVDAKAEAIMKTVDVVNRKAENSSKDLRDRIDDQSVAIMDAIHELGQLNKELEKVTK